MKNWPRQQLPQNLAFLPEQRWKMQGLPRDTGRVPRDFVLKVLYQQQPCPVTDLWSMCSGDTGCVLDSKRHLRQVLQQCREEGFVSFEKDSKGEWQCALARERYEEVRSAVLADAGQELNPMHLGLRGQAARDTAASATEAEALPSEHREEHIAQLRAAVEATTQDVSAYQRTDVEYLPYTDLNGKVKFMWWYDVRDVTAEDRAAEQAAVLGAGDKRLSE